MRSASVLMGSLFAITFAAPHHSSGTSQHPIITTGWAGVSIGAPSDQDTKPGFSTDGSCMRIPWPGHGLLPLSSQ